MSLTQLYLDTWHPSLVHFVTGAFGGLIGQVAHNMGQLPLPRLIHKSNQTTIDTGFLSGVMIGGFVGFIVDHHIMIAGLAGYVGIRVLDGIVSKVFPPEGKDDGKNSSGS